MVNHKDMVMDVFIIDLPENTAFRPGSAAS